MRKLKLITLAVLLFLAVAPAGARAFTSQCPTHSSDPPHLEFCAADVDVPFDTGTPYDTGPGYQDTTGYIDYPPGQYPAFTFSGRALSDPAGRFGNAFAFDGTDSQGLSYDPGQSPNDYDHLSPSTQLTVALWVKATSPGANRTIVARGANNCGGPGTWGLTTGPNGGLQFYGSENPYYVVPRPQTPEVPAASIWDGSWHAVAGVYDGGAGSRHVISLWVDGRQVAASDFQDPDEFGLDYTTTDGQMFFARGSDEERACGAPRRGFAGSLDQFFLYQKALTATQIGALQSAGPTTPPNVPYTPDLQGPAISGTPKVGSQLTCTDRDSLDGRSFTWERAPRPTHFENDANWFPIDNASGTQYMVQAADAGSRVRCHEYGTVTQGSDTLAADRASTSLRTDTDVPINITPPTVEGDPIVPNTLRCHPGTWQNGPADSDFIYQWVKNGAVISGNQAYNTDYGLSHTYEGATLVNPQGDGGTTFSCRVTASNDVGVGTPTVSTPPLHVVDGPPYRITPPTVTLSGRPAGDADPLHQHAICNVGSWRDDYAQLGVEGYHYSYQWYRVYSNPPSQDAIAGATDSTYQLKAEDLGRDLRCQLTVPNVAGSVSTFTGTVKVVLPSGQIDGTIYREPGRNGADPTSLLALNDSYAKPIEQSVIDHLNAGLTTARSDCGHGVGLPQNASVPDSAPNPSSVPETTASTGLDPVLRCQILLHADPKLILVNSSGGVRYDKPGCVPTPAGTTNLAGQVIHPLCPSLGIEIPSINPTHPPTGNNLGALASVQPKLILWDLNNDGVTDAICPGSAPVLRTILDPGEWTPRAVIVTGDSATTMDYHFAQIGFDNSVHYPAPAGVVRANQVRVCATSFDPPPDPATGPCVTSADFGSIHLQGNLCPVAVRALAKADYEDLLGAPQFDQLRAFMLAASEDQLKAEPGVTQVKSVRPPPATVTWANWAPSAPRDATSAADQAVAAINANTQAALTAQNSPGGYDAPSLPHVDDVTGLVDGQAAFAFEQVLVTHDPVAINGVTQEPIHGTGALLVPSAVNSALPSTHQMVLAGRDVASHLGLPGVDGIPLSTGGLLTSQLSDVPKSASDVIRATNLTDVRTELENEGTARAKELLHSLDHVGPFSLDGAVKIHAEDDGTASIEADVTLPGLASSPDGKSALTIHATLHADLEGHVALRGLHLHQDDAYLGPLHLHNLGLDYDSNAGLTITGSLLFPPPPGSGLDINKFQLGPDGQFESLDVAYHQTPGIMLGPGLFLTGLRGGYDKPSSTITAGASVAAGPSAAGCAVANLDGTLVAHFADPFILEGQTDVSVACIKFANVKFYADTSGLFTIDGHVHFPPPDVDLGPVYFDADIHAGIRLSGPHPAWQIDASGDGGIRDLLTARIEAVLSNAGFAGCGRVKIKIPLIGKFVHFFGGSDKDVAIDLAGGAAVNFVHDVPPLNAVAFLANLRLFTGCDLSYYRTVPPGAQPRAVGSGRYTFTLPEHSGASVLAFEGAGAAPHIQLRSPSGKVYDFRDAVTQGKSIGHGAWGKVLSSADETVVLLGDPAGGTWTAQTDAGAPVVVRVRQAQVLPKPVVTGHVTGRGPRRTLTYDVRPLPGQVVRLFEFARRGQKLIRTVSTGGKGRVRFTVSEASGTHRTVVAEVTQNGLPRQNLTIAHYVAPSPKVGRVRHIRVRRRGRQAVVTWGPAYFARSYTLTVRYGDGRHVPLFPRRHARSVVVPNVARGEGLLITITPISPGDRIGPPANASLAGNMHVGRVRHLPKRPKKKPTSKKHKPTKHTPTKHKQHGH